MILECREEVRLGMTMAFSPASRVSGLPLRSLVPGRTKEPREVMEGAISPVAFLMLRKSVMRCVCSGRQDGEGGDNEGEAEDEMESA